MQKNLNETLTQTALLLGGSALFGLSVNMFITPGGITMGGFTGIATTMEHFLHTPVGLMILLLNIPVITLEWRLSGFGSVWRTAVGVVGTSLMTDALRFLPPASTDPLLCAVGGGLFMGAGSGLLITRGFTTGGSDLCALLIRRKAPGFSTGRIILLLDAAIISGCAVISGNYAGIFYSFVAVWCYSTAFDKTVDGIGKAKFALIVSEMGETVAKEISENLCRGVTIIACRGWYSQTDRQALFCTVKRSQVYELCKVARRCDPSAFVTVGNASAVYGEGFSEIEDGGEKK